MSLKYKYSLLFFLYLLVFVNSSTADTISPGNVDILIISSSNDKNFLNEEYANGIINEFEKDKENHYELNWEYLPEANQNKEKIYKDYSQYLSVKYQGKLFDLIITCEDEALKYMDSSGFTVFNNIPIVFCGIKFRDSVDQLKNIKSNGIIEEIDIKNTLKLATEIHSSARHICIITDSTSLGFHYKHLVWNQLQFYLKSHIIKDFSQLSYSDLMSKLDDIEDHSIIIYFNYYKSTDGRNYDPVKVLKDISVKVNVPIYAFYDRLLFDGACGGYVIKPEQEGAEAAKLAQQVLFEDNEIKSVKLNSTSYPEINLKNLNKPFFNPEILADSVTFYNLDYLAGGRSNISKSTYIYILTILFFLLALIVLIFLILKNKNLNNKQMNYKSILKNSALGYLHLEIIGRKLLVKEMNNVALKMFGVKNENFRNKNIVELIPEFSQKSIFDQLFNLEVNGDPWVQTVNIINSDNSKLFLGISASKPYQKNIVCFIKDITTTVQSSQELQSNQLKLNTIFSNKIVGMMFLDPQGDFIKSNSTFAEMMGCSVADITDTNIMRITHPDDYEITRATLLALSEGEISQSRLESRLIRLDDSRVIWADIYVISMFDSDGKLDSIIMLTSDITNKKKSDQRLRDSEERHRVLIDMLPEGIIIFSGYKNLEALYINNTGAKILGYKNPITFLSLDLKTALGEELYDHFSEATSSIFKTWTTSYRTYHEIEVNSGSTGKKHIEYIVSQINYEESKALLCLFRDVTTRKTIEGRLRESERKLGLALKGSRLGFWEWNLKSDSHLIDKDFTINTLMLPELGEVKTHNEWMNLIHEDDVKNVQSEYEKHLNDQIQFFDHEFRIKSQFGDWRWIHEAGKIVDYDINNLPSIIAGTIADITDRKNTEIARKESEEFFQSLVESLDEGFVILDEQDCIVYANEKLSKIFNIDKDKLASNDFKKLLSALDEEIINSSFEKIHNGIYENFEVVIPSSDKQQIILNISPYLMDKQLSQKPGTFAIVDDITNKKLAEELIKNSEERLQLALKGSNSGLWDWDINNERIFFDSKWVEISGYASEDSTYEIDFLDKICHPDDLSKLKYERDNHMDGKSETFDIKHRILCNDGEYRWIVSRGMVVKRDESGNPTRMAGTVRDVDAEEKVIILKNQTQAFLRQVIDLMPHAIFAKNIEGEFLLANYSLAGLLDTDIKLIKGYNVSEVIKDEKLKEIINYDDDKIFNKIDFVQKAFNNVKFNNSEEERSFILTKIPLEIPGEDYIHVLGMIMDISQLHRARKAQEESEQKYQKLIEASPDGIILSDKGKILFHNNVISSKLGLPADIDLTGKSLFDFLPDKFREEEYEQIYNKLLNSDSPVSFEVEIVKDELHSMNAEILSTMLKNEGQNVTLSFVRDITERKKAEEKLRKSEEQLRSIFTAAATGLALIDENGKYILYNRTFTKMFGYSDEEIRSMTHRDIVHPQEVEECAKLLNRQFSGDLDTYRTDRRFIRKDGSIIYTDFYGSPIRDWNGNVESVMGIVVDVSDRVHANDKVKQSEKKFRSIVEQIHDGILLINQDGTVLEWNRALEKITGLPREDTIDEYFWDLTNRLKPEDTDTRASSIMLKKLIKEVKRNKVNTKWLNQQLELRFRNIENKPVIALITPLPIIIDNKFLIASIVRDVTERRQAEELAQIRQEQLIEAEKLVALGTLVSGVAHEINNPNNYISINSSMLIDAFDTLLPIVDEYYDENGDFIVTGIPYSEMRNNLREMLVAIEHGSDRIKKIISDMKDFARAEGKSYDEDVNVNDVIKSANSLLNSLIKHSTKHFNLDLNDEIPILKGSYHRLEQVVLNVIQNACHSLENRDKQVYISTDYDNSKDNIVIKVTDEGNGISEEDLPRLLDPFFTTKRKIGGTGLGLSVSDGIIKDHGGRIDIKSKLGEGTEVSVILPVTREK